MYIWICEMLLKMHFKIYVIFQIFAVLHAAEITNNPNDCKHRYSILYIGISFSLENSQIMKLKDSLPLKQSGDGVFSFLAH